MHFTHHKRLLFLLTIAIILIGILSITFLLQQNIRSLFTHNESHMKIKLPPPIYNSQISIEEALKQRRSIRQYKNESLTLQQVAQLLWAAQGITATNGLRTAPSAGALYPLEVYLVSGDIRDMGAGVYHYLPNEHALAQVTDGDKRTKLAEAAFKQSDVEHGAADILITAVYQRTIKKYGARGKEFVYLEAGHAAQNIYLQAISLQLGTVSIGAFDGAAVKKVLTIPNEEDPIYIMPIGKP